MANGKGRVDASTIRKRVRASVRTLEKRHTPNAVKNGRSSIEQLVFCIASRQTPERKAQGALRDLKTQFAGWNEVRVSSVLELADILRQNDVPSPIQKSEQIIRTLARTYADARKLNFDELTRDRAEEIRVYMTRKLALPSPVIADFLFSSLNYPHLPVDEQTGRVLQRLGLITNKADFPKLEKIVSEGLTAREAAHFYRVLEMHASQTCLDKAPLCSKCILLSNCPDGQKRLADAKAAALKAEADAKAAVKAAAAKAAADAALAAKAAAKAKAQAKAEALAAEKAAAKAAKEAAKKKSAPAKSKKGGQKPDPGGSRRSKK